MIKFEHIFKFVLNEKLDMSRNVLRKSDKLLKVRLWVYGVAFTHLVGIALKLLTIDFTEAEDPSLWIYANVRWKLITCWFNLVSLAYLPVCMYCDWKELRREHDQPHVRQLNQARYYCFTSFLFPATAFADILFWRLWLKNRELIAPSSVDKIVPFWTQHSMHTITLVFTTLDLILVPRKRPKSYLPGLTLMAVIMLTYFSVCIESYLKGEYLYPVFKMLSSNKLIVLIVYVVMEYLFYFFAQFVVSDFIWGKNKEDQGNKHYKIMGVR